ncbi:hypothetical protein A2276_03785 [candidate division WOR-1 bacterium RIFOXYA12_FULL_43_27]|uniref:Ada DNA repair metal-binding domain-containing protein n=1 Tax=candidate division WOR-1 bacterium RIFOXYC2_FULL_46_14 TaxID=1802587 RepID=A0A1F4U736_UNCSA|nr:MAG: hypothetical protein A2276_03785 [candidate division WOR-1 bacterium RIFOXYA12_FULL_43_27]OGC19185.1 MAG: hypothetical protein A2292_00550 [candidate division WOR-1 bacterium RIFOXYB2_FULL_46_45]OGC30174.1 MAG: hypothetical protein A2232_00550 [candidate division WOR-1 bacterium RIFOXYA2_FULL_46_56]OGC40776.1 MAG: hypothetical protein A2438_00555 [candidate division WOR-1 bacterium RIFOXYC2_FULL_46_14]
MKRIKLFLLILIVIFGMSGIILFESPVYATKEALSIKKTEKDVPKEAKKEQAVYITKSGKKYHKAGCSYLRKSQRSISLNEAKQQGYFPCSRCF